MARLALNQCQQSPDGSPCDLALQEGRETKGSSSLSRSDSMLLPRQCYSPAPLGASPSVSHGNGSGSSYSPHTPWSVSQQPHVSPLNLTVKHDHSAPRLQ